MVEIEETEEAGQTRPFAAVIQELNRGKVHSELSNELQALVAAVRETGRKGSLTLTLTINPTGDDGAVQLTDTVTVKQPKYDRAASLFYVTDDDNLVRRDPRQMELPLREATVDTRTGELKDAR